MRETIKIIVRQVWQNVGNLRFLLAVLLEAFACMMPTIVYMEGMIYERGTVFEYFFFGGFEKMAEKSFDFSAIAIVGQFSSSSFWFVMLMTAISAFPAVSLFVDEYYSGAVYFTLSGSSVNRYSAVKFVAAGLTGGLVFVCGFLLYVLLIFLRFPHSGEYPTEMIQAYQMIYDGSVGDLAGMACHVALVAFLCASVMMMLATFMRDRYFLFGIPMLFIFFLERLFLYIGLIHPGIYEEKRGWWKLLSPACYPEFYKDFEWRTGFPYGCFLILALTEWMCLFWIFRRRVGRRVRGGV